MTKVYVVVEFNDMKALDVNDWDPTLYFEIDGAKDAAESMLEVAPDVHVCEISLKPVLHVKGSVKWSKVT